MAKAVGVLRLAAVVAVVAAAASVVPGAQAQAPSIPLGYDVSYPQCGNPLPSGAAFSIVGVNAGLPFGANPCLGSQLQWAGAGAQLYANTADPGPTRSSHWPNGQTSPQQCNTAASPGADTAACAYDYGWNAAQDSYRDAVDAYVAVGLLPAGSTRTPQANVWWVDVETANSWETNPANNVADLQGEVDSLRSLGATTIGFYAPPTNWQTITGGSTQFTSYPFWLPGTASLVDAASRCSQTGANGGPLALVQFPQAGGSADIRCADVPRLAFASTAQTVGAGTATGSIVVQLPAAAADPVTTTLASRSPTGRFALRPAGPWSPTLTLTVAAGATRSPPAYYRDPTAGHPVLHAHADGYADATQTETITAAACTLPAVHDHGYELVVAHLPTRIAAEHALRRIAPQAHAHHLRPLIERDACTDFEVAITGFRNRSDAVAALRRARAAYNPEAALEHP